MIVTSTPLRISLFGGSTDNPRFIEKYGAGSVISFACNLKTYVILSQDKVGANQFNHRYVINYSVREEVDNIAEIKNEIVRYVFEHFNIKPVQVTLTSDVYSQGSGLASSSSYLISLIKAVVIFKGIHMTDSEICALAFDIETHFNPHCGYQDPYGCGVGGFKKIDFTKEGVKYQFLGTDLFKEYDMNLVFTGITRNSKVVLSSVTENIEKTQALLPLVDKAQQSLFNKDYKTFINLFNESWQIKKKTSPMITGNDIISSMDNELSNNKSVLAHKLCGAGAGGDRRAHV